MRTNDSVDFGESNPSGRDSADDDLLDVKEAARFLNVTSSWVYEHSRPGAGEMLPFLKIGKYLRFDRRDLRAYVDRKRGSLRRR
jgi:excisionase family DNA binding protein